MREACTIQQRRIAEQDISCVENSPVTIFHLDSDSTRDMPGIMQRERNALSRQRFKMPWLAWHDAQHLPVDGGDILVSIKRILADPFFHPLAIHYLVGILKHALEKSLGIAACDDGRVGEFPCQQGKGSEVIQVAMCQEYQVNINGSELIKSWNCFESDFLRVQAGVDNDIQGVQLQ